MKGRVGACACVFTTAYVCMCECVEGVGRYVSQWVRRYSACKKGCECTCVFVRTNVCVCWMYVCVYLRGQVCVCVSACRMYIHTSGGRLSILARGGDRIRCCLMSSSSSCLSCWSIKKKQMSNWPCMSMDGLLRLSKIRYWCNTKTKTKIKPYEAFEIRPSASLWFICSRRRLCEERIATEHNSLERKPEKTDELSLNRRIG